MAAPGIASGGGGAHEKRGSEGGEDGKKGFAIYG